LDQSGYSLQPKILLYVFSPVFARGKLMRLSSTRIARAFRPTCYSPQAKWNRASPRKEYDVNNQMRIIAAALAVVAAGYAGSVAAQDPVVDRTTYVSDKGDAIHCQSTQGRTDFCSNAYNPLADSAEPHVNHCAATGNGRTYCGKTSVQFVVAGGGSNPICVEGRTWGIEDGNLWVSGRCSAFF